MHLGSHIISENSPTFIIAEVGANHNGSLRLAKETIDAAAECGVDAVKFQTYTTEELLINSNNITVYGKEGHKVSESLKEMFDKVTLKREHHKELFEYAQHKNLLCFSTPFSVTGVHFLEELDNPIYKIASSDVNFIDMLEAIGKTRKPVFLSTGKNPIGDIDRAVDILIQNGNKELALLHCVAKYPAPFQEINLRVIQTLKTMFPKSIVGFSDHTQGITMALGAVSLGAQIIEKHFTLDKNLPGPDHWFSMDPEEMTSLVQEIKSLEMAFGSSRKIVTKCEKNERYWSTRSLVINRDIIIGESIQRDDLDMLRPGYGISPFERDNIVGMVVARNLVKGDVLEWKHFKH